MNCRVCFSESGNILQLGCSCKNGLEYIHLDCADKWFSDRMEIRMSGKLKDRILKVTYRAFCEICNQTIAVGICREIYKRYDKKHKTIEK